jgi:hypothetical protein
MEKNVRAPKLPQTNSKNLKFQWEKGEKVGILMRKIGWHSFLFDSLLKMGNSHAKIPTNE